MRCLTLSRLSKLQKVCMSCQSTKRKSDEIGKGVDFYNHLGIEPSATINQLNKAYRKKSLELQYVSCIMTHTLHAKLTVQPRQESWREGYSGSLR